MATDDDDENETTGEHSLDVPEVTYTVSLDPRFIEALKLVAAAELAKGPNIAGLAWRHLHDLCSETLGGRPAPREQRVVGRQPMVMPRSHNPPPARGGATPVYAGQQVIPPPSGPLVPLGAVLTDPPPAPATDIRQRDDVAAELARINATVGVGGKPPEDK